MFALLLLASTAFAAQCEYKQEFYGEMVANRFYTMSLGCVAQITPRNKPELVYREYYFDERGRFLVFQSLPGSYETATATRSYFLFPRKQEPTFSRTADGSIEVRMASGGAVYLSAQEAKVLSMPGLNFSEPAGGRLEREAFLSIEKYPGLLLDTGWKIGATGYSDRNATSEFRDSAGHACSVSNSEIFDYVNILYGEPTFYYETDAKLAAFLKERCPQLEVVF